MELLGYTFIQYAFIGGSAVAVLSGLLGPFVVQSRQSIASDMFAHVALAGIGMALIIGVAPWWGALPALLLVSTVIWWLMESERYSADSVSMFFLSGGLALALALVHVARDTVFSFENYLFGSILTLNQIDVVAILVSTAVVGLILSAVWYPLLGATQNPRFVVPYDRTAKIVSLVFFWLLAVVVWVGIKTIGGLLIGALLVIPVLVGRDWVTSFRQLSIASVSISTLSVIVGLTVALYVDLPPSSLIIGTLIALFVVQLIARKLLAKSQ